VITVKRKLEFGRRPDRTLAIVEATATPRIVPTVRIPRIAKLMGLAIHFDRLIREGVVQDMSELARLAHVTQPRMTQIANLSHLSPGIQEALLFLAPLPHGRETITERSLRPITAIADWSQQRRLWDQLIASRAMPT
jgi:hypothetical protein